MIPCKEIKDDRKAIMTEQVEMPDEDGARLSDGFRHEQMFVLNAQASERFQMLTGDTGLYLTDVGFYPDAAGHYRARPSGCPSAILLYVRKGRGTVKLPGKTVQLSENEAFVIPPGTPHLYFANRQEPWSLFWVHAGGAALAGVDTGVRRKLAGPRAAQRMEMYFEMIFQTLQEGLTDGNFRYLDRLLQTVFAEVSFREEGRGMSGGNRVVNRIIILFGRSLSRSLTLADLSEETGLSGLEGGDNEDGGVGDALFIAADELQDGIPLFFADGYVVLAGLLVGPGGSILGGKEQLADLVLGNGFSRLVGADTATGGEDFVQGGRRYFAAGATDHQQSCHEATKR